MKAATHGPRALTQTHGGILALPSSSVADRVASNPQLFVGRDSADVVREASRAHVRRAFMHRVTTGPSPFEHGPLARPRSQRRRSRLPRSRASGSPTGCDRSSLRTRETDIHCNRTDASTAVGGGSVPPCAHRPTHGVGASVRPAPVPEPCRSGDHPAPRTRTLTNARSNTLTRACAYPATARRCASRVSGSPANETVLPTVNALLASTRTCAETCRTPRRRRHENPKPRRADLPELAPIGNWILVDERRHRARVDPRGSTWWRTGLLDRLVQHRPLEPVADRLRYRPDLFAGSTSWRVPGGARTRASTHFRAASSATCV